MGALRSLEVTYARWQIDVARKVQDKTCHFTISTKLPEKCYHIEILMFANLFHSLSPSLVLLI